MEISIWAGVKEGASRSEPADRGQREARGELVRLPRKAGRGRLSATPKPLLSPALARLRGACAQPAPGAYTLMGLIFVPQHAVYPMRPVAGVIDQESVRTWLS